MTKKRIKELADFFYSSDSADDVPLRLCCETGRYTGFDLNREQFISLFCLLANSKNLKKDLKVFIEAVYAK